MVLKWAKRLAPLFMIGISMGVTLLALELGLRLWMPQDRIQPMLAQLDPEIIYTLTPNHDAYLKGTSPRMFHLRTNAQGLRDRDIPFDKPESVYRILLLGDSVSMAEGVELEEIYLKRLEALLNERPGRRVETVNAAIRGYGNDQELILFRRLGKRFNADLAILAFYTSNDFDDNWNGQLFRVEDGQLIQQRPTPETSRKFRYYAAQSRAQQLPGYAWFMARSHLANWLRIKVAAVLVRRVYREASPPAAAPAPFEAQPSTLLTAAILKAWHQEARSSGADALVMIIPKREDARALRLSAEPATPRVDRIMEEFCRRETIACFNLTHALIRYPGDFEALWLACGHLSPEGHRWVARELADFLRSARLAP